MTWTKIGGEWGDESVDMSDAAARTHVEALCWANRHLTDLVVPKRMLRRFAGTAAPELAAEELVKAGWWDDRGDNWWIGCRFRSGNSTGSRCCTSVRRPPFASAGVADTTSASMTCACPRAALSPVTHTVTASVSHMVSHGVTSTVTHGVTRIGSARIGTERLWKRSRAQTRTGTHRA